MGATNAMTVFTYCSELPHRAKAVLLYMALVSLDPGDSQGRPSGRYFGEPDALTRAVFGKVDAASSRSARAALTELERAGVIDRVVTGRRKHRAVYQLVLDPRDRRNVTHPQSTSGTSATPDRLEERDVPRLEERHVRLAGTSGARDGNATFLPRKTGTTKEQIEEQHHLGRPPHLRPVIEDGYAAAHALLSRLDPDRSQALMAEAEAEGVEGPTAQVIRAAELAPRKTG